MTHPSSPPAPMTASRLMELLDIAGRNPSDIALKKEIERQLREGADALTARVAELERERDVRGEEFAIALTGLQSELAAARKVDDAEVVEAVDWLLDRAECSSVTLDPSPMGPIAGLLTRLSAALKEAEARETDAKTLQHQLASDLTVAVARALQTKDTTP